MKIEANLKFIFAKFEVFFGVKKLQMALKANKLAKGYEKLYTEEVKDEKGKKHIKLKKECVGLAMPKDGLKPQLKFSLNDDISYPVAVDNREYIPETKDQGNLPYCAAYSSTKFLEQYIWKKTHKKVILDPIALYKEAKRIDGMPNTLGTDLESALKACMNLGYIDKKKFEIRMIYPSRSALTEIKAAIHKHTAVLMGFDITSEWFKPTKFKDDFVITGHNGQPLGGHAVLCCGYTNDKIEISNSWGNSYANNGIVFLTEAEFNKSFLYGALLVKKKKPLEKEV